MVSTSQFRRLVWRFYRTLGKHDLPWRTTSDPYHILVSELMLQQTQVARVLPKYKIFLELFPTVEVLAKAPLREVLSVWQGLGYNRRAKFLHETAKIITSAQLIWPRTIADLEALPGIGWYTARAIMAFAYNAPVVLLETNIRTVFLHHFYKDQYEVPEAAILSLVEATASTRRSREWYYALMDYGAHLKRTIGNQNKRSKQYTKQTRFKGSNRQIRGAIIREGKMTRVQLCRALPDFLKERIAKQLSLLCAEGLVEQNRHYYQLPESTAI